MTTPPCSCGQPAIASVSGQNLCVEHAIAWQNAINTQQAHNLAMMNMLRDQIEDTMGVPRTQRTLPPQPIIHHGGAYTFNQIQVDRSVVGSINTAQVEQINVTLENVNNQGEEGEKVAIAIKNITEAILQSKELEKEIREEMIESLAFLVNQANIPKNERHPTIIKNVLQSISKGLSTLADLATIWTLSSPIITSFLLQPRP